MRILLDLTGDEYDALCLALDREFKRFRRAAIDPRNLSGRARYGRAVARVSTKVRQGRHRALEQSSDSDH